MLYKYPQAEPIRMIRPGKTNRRTYLNLEPEYELLDTGLFNDGKYFDVFTEYAKNDYRRSCAYASPPITVAMKQQLLLILLPTALVP